MKSTTEVRGNSRKPGDHKAESANLRRMLDFEEKTGVGET